jgi:hypothetical protein
VSISGMLAGQSTVYEMHELSEEVAQFVLWYMVAKRRKLMMRFGSSCDLQRC